MATICSRESGLRVSERPVGSPIIAVKSPTRKITVWPRALEIAQLLERDGMAQMQVGRGRIHPELDAQRAPLAQLGRQLLARDDFEGVAPQLPRLLFGVVLVHVSD